VKRPPRSLFRHRARERSGRRTWAEALKPGRVTQVVHWHDPGCRRPQGESCTCKAGPDVELVPLDLAADRN
jgi:hypothetical protein